MLNSYRSFIPIKAEGWYREAITYDGTAMIFQLFDSGGRLLSSGVNVEPGFVPKAVVINAGSKSQYNDDLFYSTW
jgi:hypothetical protein